MSYFSGDFRENFECDTKAWTILKEIFGSNLNIGLWFSFASRFLFWSWFRSQACSFSHTCLHHRVFVLLLCVCLNSVSVSSWFVISFSRDFLRTRFESTGVMLSSSCFQLDRRFGIIVFSQCAHRSIIFLRESASSCGHNFMMMVSSHADCNHQSAFVFWSSRCTCSALWKTTL